MKGASLALAALTLAVAACTGPEGLNGVNVTPANPSVPVVSGTQQFAAEGFFNSQTHRDISASVTWSSSAPGVATVDANGLATAVSVGTTTISAETEAFKTSFAKSAAIGTTTLSVSPTLTPADPALDVGGTLAFAATGAVSSKRIRDVTRQVAWSSSDTAVAAIDAATGVARAVGAGTATITASLGGITGTTTLRVTSETPFSLSVTGAEMTVPAGLPRKFAAVATYADETKHDVTTLAAWISSDPSVATVDGKGSATAVAPGSTVIQAALGGVSGSATLEVSSAALASIAIARTTPMPVGVAQQLVATGRYSDGRDYDVTSQVAWASTNPSVASVDAGGRASATAQGVTTVTGTLGGVSSADIVLQVGSEAPASISVRPSAATVPVGAFRTLTAVGEFSEGMQYDISSLVTWSSSDPAVATVDPSGLATAVAAGGATVTATLGDKTATSLLTVTSE